VPSRNILSGFASLVTPPVSAPLAVADRVATGIEKVIRANGTDPRLRLHTSLTAADRVVVVDAPNTSCRVRNWP
jgi:hypothetical protein